jgi:geranylgeranyl pyrophosphate synthase
MHKSLTFKEFFEHAQRDVRREIDRRIKDEDMLYALEGGKLLRPAMLLLSFRACNAGGDTSYERAVESAIGVELAHSASLVHDDIMDGDIKRRGKPALHIKSGVANAILTGHRMINIAFRISLDHGLQNAQIFLDTWNHTLIGQIKDVDFTYHLDKILNGGHSPEILLREYFKIIDMKTASLFAAACRAGAIEADASQDVKSLLRKYGREIGLAYQLADDLVDIAEGKIEEGIIMPLIKACGNNLNEDAIQLLMNGGTTIENELKRRGMNLTKIYEGEIKRHVKKAQEISMSPLIPLSRYKPLLKEAPSYITNKMAEKIGVLI